VQGFHFFSLALIFFTPSPPLSISPSVFSLVTILEGLSYNFERITRYLRIKSTLLFKTWAQILGFITQGTGFTRLLKCRPRFFIAPRHLLGWCRSCDCGSVNRRDVGTIKNTSSIYQAYKVSLMNEHLLVGIDVGCHSHQVAIAESNGTHL